MFSNFDTILACDGQTYGQTDILRQHIPRYAMHTHRAVKINRRERSHVLHLKRVVIGAVHRMNLPQR